MLSVSCLESRKCVASKQADLSRGLAKNLSNVSNPDNLTRNLGPRFKTTATFSKYQARDPQTKTQHLLRKVETNYFTPRNCKFCVGISNPTQLCSCSGTSSSYNIFRFNSSPHRCRSEETSFIGGNKDSPLFKGEFLQQTVPSSEKRRNVSPSNRPEPTQQVCSN